MAPWGKVHSAVQHAGMRVKSGLLWANHQYGRGMALAGKANDLFETGKRVAGLFMPAMDRLVPGAQQAMMGGIGAWTGRATTWLLGTRGSWTESTRTPILSPQRGQQSQCCSRIFLEKKMSEAKQSLH